MDNYYSYCSGKLYIKLYIIKRYSKKEVGYNATFFN